MSNTIKCPHCGKNFELTDAFAHEIQEKAKLELSEKHSQEIAEIKKLSDEESSKRISKLTTQIEELLDEKRFLKEKAEEAEIEIKKKLMEAEEKIKIEVRRKAEEEHQLKDLEKDKKLSDALSQIEILKTKMQQGSQQTQGESLELELEQKLKSEFPTDEISEVKKGVRGADLVQVVVDKLGRKCGTILWESKNAKWSDSWINKFKEDGRQAKADVLVLVSANLPQNGKSYIDGVWIAGINNYVNIAWALRFSLISLYHERNSQEGRDEKMKIMYDYINGSEFRNRMEGIMSSFTKFQEQIESEKRFFSRKWAHQEKELRKMIDHSNGLLGDLEGVIGKSLPEIKTLEIEE